MDHHWAQGHHWVMSESIIKELFKCMCFHLGFSHTPRVSDINQRELDFLDGVIASWEPALQIQVRGELHLLNAGVTPRGRSRHAGPFRRLCCRVHGSPPAPRRGRQQARARAAFPVGAAVSTGEGGTPAGVCQQRGRSPGVGWPDTWAPAVRPGTTADARRALLGALRPSPTLRRPEDL